MVLSMLFCPCIGITQDNWRCLSQFNSCSEYEALHSAIEVTWIKEIDVFFQGIFESPHYINFGVHEKTGFDREFSFSCGIYLVLKYSNI